MILMRHPPVAAKGLCYGRLDPGLAPGWEPPLDERIPALAQIPAIHASPSPRARTPARRLAAALGAPLILDARLQELDFGRWEGRAWNALPRPELDLWAEDPERRAPPGGETFAALAARVAAALADAPDGALILAHAGPIRALLMRARGLDFRAAFADPVPYADPFPLGGPR